MADLLIERFFSDEYPELLRTIATDLFLQLGELPSTRELGDEQLARVAFSVTEHVRRELGGTTHYIPMGESHDLSVRDQEIFDKFRGDYKVLAKEYEMSEMRIRQIIERCRRAENRRRQTDLFSAKIAETEK